MTWTRTATVVSLSLCLSRVPCVEAIGIRLTGVVKGIVQWPNYRDGPRNIVLRVDQSYVEKDTYRADGMAYINTILR